MTSSSLTEMCVCMCVRGVCPVAVVSVCVCVGCGSVLFRSNFADFSHPCKAGLANIKSIKHSSRWRGRDHMSVYIVNLDMEPVFGVIEAPC